MDAYPELNTSDRHPFGRGRAFTQRGIRNTTERDSARLAVPRSGVGDVGRALVMLSVVWFLSKRAL